MVSAGEALNPEVIEAWREATGLDDQRRLRPDRDRAIWPATSPATRSAPGSMGRPLPGLELRMVDGELQVRVESCPTFFDRYLDAEPFDGEWWPTGDVVREDDDGYLWYEGRNDDLILSAGYRIGPFEVESALLTHPAVAEAAAVAGARSRARRGRPGDRRPARPRALRGARARAAGARQGGDRAVQVPADRRVRRRAAEDRERKDQARPAAPRVTSVARMPTPRSIQRTYLTLMLGNTLAASFIWGINTIFLLDAGLLNAEAFAANAFFTAGHGDLRGPDRDRRRHGRAPHLVSARARVTLTASTASTSSWQVEAPFWEWAAASLLLGLGFTFFSGVVEAWLVDALAATGFDRRPRVRLRPRPDRLRLRDAHRFVAGGLIAQATSLGVPFVVRAGVLPVMFVIACWLMDDVGFTPEKGTAAARRDAQDRLELGRVRLAGAGSEMADGRAAVHRRRRLLRLLRPAAVPA